MKSLLTLAVLVGALSAQAQTAPKAAPTKAAPAPAASHATGGIAGHHAVDTTKNPLKDLCLKENPKLAGAELEACVKSKEKK
jgi:opacity protein-like surface antigen